MNKKKEFKYYNDTSSEVIDSPLPLPTVAGGGGQLARFAISRPADVCVKPSLIELTGEPNV